MGQQAGYLTLLFKAAFAAALIVSAIIASDLTAKIAIIYSMVFLVATYMIHACGRPVYIREQNRLDIKRLWQRKTILGACDSWYNLFKLGPIHPE